MQTLSRVITTAVCRDGLSAELLIAPGLPGFPNQTVFLPEGLDALNSNATFRVVAGSF